MLSALFLSAFIGACGGGGGGAAPPPVPTQAAQNPGGVWSGQSVSAAAADVSTSFEFRATGPFTRGVSPYTHTYSSGNAETRGIPQFYITGSNAWHILTGTSATVTFETLPNTLTFFVRTENAADVSNIDIFDADGALIQNVVPTNAFQMISVFRGAGQTLIGSVEVTSTSEGDVVIDDLTFGYSGSGFAGATDDIDCLVADNLEFVCILSDTGTGDVLATVGGTVLVANNTEVSGFGTLYAVPGSVLADGNTFANVTISAGTVSEANTLDLTVDAAGPRAPLQPHTMLFTNVLVISAQSKRSIQRSTSSATHRRFRSMPLGSLAASQTPGVCWPARSRSLTPHSTPMTFQSMLQILLLAPSVTERMTVWGCRQMTWQWMMHLCLPPSQPTWRLPAKRSSSVAKKKRDTSEPFTIGRRR